MRINQYIASAGITSRRKADELIEDGRVRINGAVLLNPGYHVQEGDVVEVDGARIQPEQKKVYYLLNKPAGYVTSTADKEGRPVVTDLVPDSVRVFPVGRLDKDTVGLMILTNDGVLAHTVLSPKRHVEKKYYFKAKLPMSREDAMRFEGGVTLEDGYVTKPAKIELSDDGCEGVITLHEGKYHQIKRMLEALDNKIVYLERISFACFTLEDSGLSRGAWRYLNNEEIAKLEELAGFEA
jgi:pseudouridine synthase